MPTNTFAVDYTETLTDINNPPRKRYNPNAPENQFPKMVYNHENGHTLMVKNGKEEAQAAKRGFVLQADPRRDYSKSVPGRVAAPECTRSAFQEEVPSLSE